MKKSAIDQIITATVIFVFGFTGGFVVARRDILQLEFKRDVDVADVLSLIVTLVLALYLQNYVAARWESRRSQRTRVRELLVEVKTAAKSIHQMTRRQSVDPAAFLEALTDCDRAIVSFKHAVEAAKIDVAVPALWNAWRDYRAAVSSGSFPHKPMSLNESESGFKSL